jgi:putative NADH-flavin reductase
LAAIMQKIAILGAGGKLGTRLVHEALSNELHVNAVTRDPTKLGIAHANFNVFKGDAEKGEGLDRAVLGCRYVVSVVSSPRPPDCVAHLLKAMAA